MNEVGAIFIFVFVGVLAAAAGMFSMINDDEDDK